jgi:Flp pilus assembly protein CpaB
LRRSNKILLIFGVLLAAVSFVAVLAFGTLNQQAQAPADPDVSVVVAAQNIELGTAVSADMLATVNLPESQATDTYQAPDELIGQVVRREVTQGEALTSEDFQSGVSVPQLVSAIPNGMRAIAVPLSRVDSVGLLLQPGDWVDVVLTIKEIDGLNPIVVENPEEQTGGIGGDAPPYQSLDEFVNNTTVKVVVQNVQVLAALPREAVDSSNSAEAPVEPQPDLIAILSVQPQQVEVIRFAQMDGNVSVVLRSPTDVSGSQVDTTGITLSELVNQWGVLPPAPITAPVEP